MALDHILCAVDDSEPSARAAQLAAEMAAGLGARLTLVSVRRFALDRTAAGGLATPEEIDASLAAAEDIARSAGCRDINAVQLEGREIAESLVEYAAVHGVRLVVMGSSGKNVLERLALGSTSMEFLHQSDCPVTLVH